MSAIENTLKKAIEECGLSHAELGRRTGVNRLTIDRFVNGTNLPSMWQADLLCEFLGLELVPAKKTKRTRKDT